MNRKDGFSFQVVGCLNHFFRHHMNIGPHTVVLTRFKNGKVKGPKPFPDLFKMMIVPGTLSKFMAGVIRALPKRLVASIYNNVGD